MQSVLDISTVELTRTVLRLIPELKFIPQRYGTDTWYHVEVTSTSQFYRMGYAEYAFVSLLDGQTSFAQALAISAQALGDSALTQSQALTVYQWLIDKGMAEFADTDVRSGKAKGERQTTGGRKSLLRRLNPLWIRLPLGKPEPLLKATAPLLGWLFSVPATVAGIAFAIFATCTLCADWTKFSESAASVFAPDNWLWLLIAWMGLKVIHEIGHGLVCLRYGGTIREMGIVFAFFAPLAFVDATSCWSFRSRAQRIHTAAAGVYIELLVASVASVWWSHTDSVVVAHLLHNVIVMATLSTLLFNINPLMKFDGYYILSDLLNIPNLASESSTALSQLVRRVAFGEIGCVPAVAGQKRWLLVAYGISAVFWRLLICGSILIAASVFFHGAGVVLAVVGVIAWFGPPLVRLAKLLLATHRGSPARLFRATLISSAAIAAGLALLLSVPPPVMSTAPGVVEYKDGQIVRAATAGFIRRVHVVDGQAVKSGDLLLELENKEVDQEYLDVVRQIRQEEIRLQRATREYDSGAISISQGNLRSLNQKAEEAEVRRAGLQLRAQTDGRVVSRRLNLMKDTHVDEGQELLTIGLENRKELRLSIGQPELSTALQWRNCELPIRVGTRPVVTGLLQRVNPRASQSLTHPALAATSGGSLAVIENSDRKSGADKQSPLKLTEHRFDAVIEFGPEQSRRLFCGERATVSFGVPDGSLAVHLYRSGRHWLQAQLDTASQAR